MSALITENITSVEDLASLKLVLSNIVDTINLRLDSQGVIELTEYVPLVMDAVYQQTEVQELADDVADIADKLDVLINKLTAAGTLG